ncbi:MAG: FHA domain-containing protein, partial [Myxococcota bacterium]
AEGMRYLVLSPVLTQLDHLNLDQNEVGDEGIQSLMASPRPAQMRVLSLNACTISDAGAKLLAQGDWPCLERLELKLNTVGQEGALALAEAPGLSPSLRRIWRQHAAAQPLTLELEPGGRRYTVLPGESVQIGRTADNDLVLGYPTVPRQQCTLSVTQEAAHLRDTRSASGTYINGVAQHDKALRIDDHIQLGPVTARVMSVP